MHPLQEKFQIIAPNPATAEPPENWATFESSRQSQSSVPQWVSSNSGDVDVRTFNKMPPGMDISTQCSAEINNMPLSMAGATDVTDCLTPAAMHPNKGFTTHPMKGADDSYTGEHVDHFYGDSGGFAERNNYLDRL